MGASWLQRGAPTRPRRAWLPTGGLAAYTPTMIREYPDRPFVGIGAVILRPGAALLVRRGRPPGVGRWSLPGGAQAVGETAEAAARRELLEETGLTVGPMLLAGMADSIHQDPDGRIRFHYTILDYAARWTGGVPAAGDDVTDARFWEFDAFGALDLTADAVRIIAAARQLLP